MTTKATPLSYVPVLFVLSLFASALQAQTLQVSALTNELPVHDETLTDLFEFAPEVAIGPNGAYAVAWIGNELTNPASRRTATLVQLFDPNGPG